jgi:leucyl/phenylalanyl-tRNA--protein transferase
MTEVRWLSPSDAPGSFPSPDRALSEPNGLLAVGGDLSPERLLIAYSSGIFPWYEEGQPILWWSPDPRAVLWPERLRVSRRLARTLRRTELTLTADTAFGAVIDGCAAPRRYSTQTWITAEMNVAYQALHEIGWAHSFEAWQDAELVGGVYGVALGRVFFGESMFSRVSNASKITFVRAIEFLRLRGFALIDCQLWSGHLQSLGATMLPRSTFLQEIRNLCDPFGDPGYWTAEFKHYCGQFSP